MAEYIERRVATNIIGNIDTSRAFDDKDDIVEQAIAAIDHMPAADVEPVRHGRWLISSDGYYPYCSRCKSEPESRAMTSFCPNCGAKMDLEETK